MNIYLLEQTVLFVSGEKMAYYKVIVAVALIYCMVQQGKILV